MKQYKLSLTLDLLRIAQALVLVFGLVVVYYASKGYSRTKSKSMLLLAVGFAFVSVGAMLAGVMYELLNQDLVAADALQSAAQAVGFIIIVFSLTGTKD